jgi:hypothetical protein
VTHRIGKLLVLAAALVGVACIDMSAPNGPASISVLQLPSPSVVVGDVMRDSNGAPAPLAVTAYDANDAPLSGLSAQFFVTDTLHIAHIDAENRVFGDKIGTTRILGQIGSLQTSAVTVPVTYAPDHIAIAGRADSLNAPLGADSATSVGTLSLPVSVKSAQDSAAQGFIVKYAIVHAPATVAGAKSPAVYLTSESGTLASADTSDGSGQASPRLVVNSLFLAARDTLYATAQTGKKDSVIVEASAKYKGVPLSGSPVRFVVKVTVH